MTLQPLAELLPAVVAQLSHHNPGRTPPMTDTQTTGADLHTPAPIPTIGQPDLSPAYYDFDDQAHCAGAGWDLSWGCRLTIGYSDTATDDDGNGVGPEELHVTVSTSDEDQRRGITVRKVTPEQVRAYAHHLLALVGEPDSEVKLPPKAGA